MRRRNSKPTSAEAFDAAWAKLLEGKSGRPEGSGWKSVAEIADIMEITVRGADAWAENKYRKGTMERASGRGKNNRLCKFYRPVK